MTDEFIFEQAEKFACEKIVELENKVGKLDYRQIIWIKRSFFVYNVLNSGWLTPKERPKKIKTLGEKLKYSRAQIYNYKDAGGRLLHHINYKKETLPQTLTEFLGLIN